MTNKRLMKPSDFPMAQEIFDDDHLCQPTYLKSIAMEMTMEAEVVTVPAAVLRDLIDDNGGQWTVRCLAHQRPRLTR